MKSRDLYKINVIEKAPKKNKDNRLEDIDYNDQKQLVRLIAKHLANIFIATHKKKILENIDKLK